MTKTDYIATSEFHHRGRLVEMGAPIKLTAIEARYLGHAIAPAQSINDARAAIATLIARKPEPEASEPPRRRRKKAGANGPIS